MLKAVIAGINKISDFLGLVSGILICALACLLIYDVFMRFLFNAPVDWPLDITQLLQAAVAFLAAAYVLKVGGHVNMSALVSNVSPRWGLRLSIVGAAVTCLTSGWMAILSWSLFTKSLAISEQSFGIEIPLAPWKFLVPFGFGLMCLQALAMALNLWMNPDEFMREGKEGH
ncbi:MAG: TRAP transporter small permease [Desulfobacteraceae bacterium]|nr:MAG: TRAP transporter small permease [Desulfobacteraceae bacterium]